jgi:hypothetical protein
MDVRFQERERILGVMRRETLPWPPRRRIRGVGRAILMLVLLKNLYFVVKWYRI